MLANWRFGFLIAGWEFRSKNSNACLRNFIVGRPRERARGTGLGLSICKGFVEAHNGRILAKCREQGGTEVAFFLPVQATL